MKYAGLFLLLIVSLSCFRQTAQEKGRVDTYNDLSYRYRYVNIDSVLYYANLAYQLSSDYTDGRNEAVVNRAFVAYQQMNYNMALNMLSQVMDRTKNQYVHAVSDVLMMKISQRIGDGENFFKSRNRAMKFLNRIGEGYEKIDERHQRIVNYVSSELHIVSSTYYYYLGLDSAAIDEIGQAYLSVQDGKDTAQWLNYNYMLGSGGLVKGDSSEVCLAEFDYLMRTYTMALRRGYVYFEANALQSLATLLSDSVRYHLVQQERGSSLEYICAQFAGTGDESNLSESLARHSIALFTSIKDLFQTACAYRTLGEIFFIEGRYNAAFGAFQYALTLVENQRKRSSLSVKPWMAGIREKMSMVYSALDNKQMSDYNRKIYLELLDQSRQNYESETRLQELTQEVQFIRTRIIVLGVLILVSIFLFVLLSRRVKSRAMLFHRHISNFTQSDSYRAFDDKVSAVLEHLSDESDLKNDEIEMSRLHIENYRSGNLERRAKVSLVYSIIPYLDRMIAEVKKMRAKSEPDRQGLLYVRELSEEILRTNAVLTDWIKMSHGQLTLHISTFPLQKLLDVISLSRLTFSKKNIELKVCETEALVKADEALTLFMINTLVDNARKFTPAGGSVSVEVTELPDYVEVGITDTGIGMSEADVTVLNDSKIYNARDIGQPGEEKGYGFGIMNCKGIINTYRKLSQAFSVCQFGVSSTLGSGSRFWFRLPRVVTLLALLFLASSLYPAVSESDQAAYDSLYNANVSGRYSEALAIGDSLLKNMQQPIDTAFVVALRNEISTSALALHRWDVYNENNTECVRLHKLFTQDNSIAAYCQRMETLQSDSVFVYVLLVLFSLLAGVMAYFLFLRGRLKSDRQYSSLIDELKELTERAVVASSHYDQKDADDLQDVMDSDIFLGEAEAAQERFSMMISDDGALLASLGGIVHDVTERYESLRSEAGSLISKTEEQQKLTFQANRLYVMNQILDNCLSTIKHETMYYPARAQQMLQSMTEHEATVAELEELDELLAYYKEVYMLLYYQAERQLEKNSFRRVAFNASLVLDGFSRELKKSIARDRYALTLQCSCSDDLKIVGDAKLLQRLLCLLVQDFLPQCSDVTVSVASEADDMAVFSVTMKGPSVSSAQAAEIFSPLSGRISYLIARQIVREHDACCGYPGLRLYAVAEDETSFVVRFNILRGLKGSCVPSVASDQRSSEKVKGLKG